MIPQFINTFSQFMGEFWVTFSQKEDCVMNYSRGHSQNVVLPVRPLPLVMNPALSRKKLLWVEWRKEAEVAPVEETLVFLLQSL